MKTGTIIAVMAAVMCACGPNEFEKRKVEMQREEFRKAAERIVVLEKQIARDREIQGKSETLILTLHADNSKLASEVDSLRFQLEHANSKMQTMRQLGRAEAQLEALTESPRTRSTYIPATPAFTHQPTPEAPAWRYPTVDEARKIIRKMADDKWGENFRMVEYEVEKQTGAHQSLNLYEKKRWSSPVVRRALNNAGAKWGMNFNMVLYELENQLEAKDRLDVRR